MIEEFSGFEAHDFALRAQYGVEDIGDSGTIYRSMEDNVKAEEFKASVAGEAPPAGLSTPLAALWWEAKGDWARAHGLVDELETGDGTAVHAYLHRKEGSSSNAEYW